MLAVIKVFFVHWLIVFLDLLLAWLLKVQGGTAEIYCFMLLPLAIFPTYYSLLLKKYRVRHPQNVKLCKIAKVFQIIFRLCSIAIALFILLLLMFPDP